MFAHLSRTHQKGLQKRLWCICLLICLELIKKDFRRDCGLYVCSFVQNSSKKDFRRDYDVYVCPFVQNSSKRSLGETVVYIFAHMSRTHQKGVYERLWCIYLLICLELIKKGVQERLCCIYLLICLELTARVVIVTNCVRPTEGVAACLDAFASNIQP